MLQNTGDDEYNIVYPGFFSRVKKKCENGGYL